jgi:hypothetical protein
VPALIHVGWPKTGTSTLQQHLFPAFGGSDLVGPHSGLFYRFTQDLIQNDDETYMAHTWAGFIADLRERLPVLILSREDLTKDGRTERIAGRLHALLPDARILACVRNQRTLIPSFYAQHVRDGCPQRFERWLEDNVPRRWHYDVGVEHFQARFGADRVTVLAFEQLIEDPAGFAAAVSAAALDGEDGPEAGDLPVTNQRASRAARTLSRTLNRLFRSSPWQRDPLVAQLPIRYLRRATRLVERVTPSTGTGLSDAETARLESLLPSYEASNARLEALTGLDVGRYGYPLPSATPVRGA